MTGHDDPDQAARSSTACRSTRAAATAFDARCTSSTARPTRSSASRARAASTTARASTDKTLTEFADGDHCVTNRSNEKHMLIADWFADRLVPSA